MKCTRGKQGNYSQHPIGGEMLSHVAYKWSCPSDLFPNQADPFSAEDEVEHTYWKGSRPPQPAVDTRRMKCRNSTSVVTPLDQV